MEFELPRVGGNNMKTKAYAVNQKFSVMVPNRNLIQELWPNFEPKMKHEILQNAYEGETHILLVKIIIGKWWTIALGWKI